MISYQTHLQALKGFSAYKLYVDATVGKFSAGLAAGMGSNNADWDGAVTKDAAFTEVDASVSYAFDENVTYTIAGGYAMTTDWKQKTTKKTHTVYITNLLLSSKITSLTKSEGSCPQGQLFFYGDEGDKEAKE